jgi:hypothetical protein
MYLLLRMTTFYATKPRGQHQENGAAAALFIIPGRLRGVGLLEVESQKFDRGSRPVLNALLLTGWNPHNLAWFEVRIGIREHHRNQGRFA